MLAGDVCDALWLSLNRNGISHKFWSSNNLPCPTLNLPMPPGNFFVYLPWQEHVKTGGLCVSWHEGSRIVCCHSFSHHHHIGHYVSAELGPSQSSSSELVIATYSTAAYICNYTFSYQVHNGAELVLRDSSGTVIWSSGTSNTWQWVHVTLRMEDVQYSTDQLSDELQFVLVRPPSVSSRTLRVFLDDVNVDFCLPCDFQQLQSSGMCSVLVVTCISAT